MTCILSSLLWDLPKIHSLTMNTIIFYMHAHKISVRISLEFPQFNPNHLNNYILSNFSLLIYILPSTLCHSSISFKEKTTLLARDYFSPSSSHNVLSAFSSSDILQLMFIYIYADIVAGNSAELAAKTHISFNQGGKKIDHGIRNVADPQDYAKCVQKANGF